MGLVCVCERECVVVYDGRDFLFDSNHVHTIGRVGVRYVCVCVCILCSTAAAAAALSLLSLSRSLSIYI